MPVREMKPDDRHEVFFQEFVEYELAVGGPDPHMKIAAYLASNVEDPAWFIGCYIAPYNVAVGEVIHNRWRTAAEVVANSGEFNKWITERFDDFPVRKERRAVMGVVKFVEHMLSYAQWTRYRLPVAQGADSFEEAFDVVSEIRFNGRYGSMKTYEALRRAGFVLPPFVDIQPNGGWSPRLALSWLRPDAAEALNGPFNAESDAISQEVAAEVRDALSPALDWFDFEVMLCDYKQAYDGRQYPGRAHDSELGHGRAVAAAFPEVPLRLWVARSNLFPHVALGERPDYATPRWDGRRKELGDVILRYGYTWTDLLYDYSETTDLSVPMRWDAMENYDGLQEEMA